MNWYKISSDNKESIEIDGIEYAERPKNSCGPSGSMGEYFNLKIKDKKCWVPVDRLEEYKKTCEEIKEDLKDNKSAIATIKLMKTSQEFSQEYVGADATFTSGQHIQDVKTRNTENAELPSNISNLPSGFEGVNSIVKKGKERLTDKCEKCRMPLEEFEWLGYSFTNNNGEREAAYKCNNCGHKNHYTQQISRVKKHRRNRRGFSVINILKEAATPANPTSSGSTYNNPANTPFGRLDMTEDQRVIPWSSVKDGFSNEFDTQKQKSNKEYEIKEVKGKDGKKRIVRVRKRNSGGDAIQPSNTWTQRGRLKNQRRYNPLDPRKTKENPGSWPHNRNLTGPGSGWYQSEYSNNFDSDMRQRVNSWDDYISNRGQYSLSRPY